MRFCKSTYLVLQFQWSWGWRILSMRIKDTYLDSFSYIQHELNQFMGTIKIWSGWSAWSQSSCSSRLRLFKFNAFNFDFLIDKLVDISDNCRTLDVHEDKWRCEIRIKSTIGTSDRSRIDVESVFMFIGFKFVGMAGDQDVTIKLSVDGCQSWKPKKVLFKSLILIELGF